MTLKLRPYQEKGVEFLLSRKRCALFDGMRVGKTPQAIVATDRLKATHILVVCPASVRINWEKEWKKWAPHQFILNLRVVSYNFIQKEHQALELGMVNWSVIICDESHHLGKWSAAQTRHFVRHVAPKGQRLWLLSGTPAIKSAADLHPQLSLLLPGRLGNFKDWQEKYCEKKTVGYGKWQREIYDGFKNTTELNKLVKTVSIRRTLKQVNKELPEQEFSNLYVDVDAPEPPDVDPDEEDSPPESLLPYLNELGQLKAKECKDFILEFPEKLVIFCWFKAVKEYLLDILGKDALPISGSESATKKQKAIDTFTDGKLKCVVVNIAAGGVGIDLSAASTSLFIEFPWSAALYEQAWHRIVNNTNKVHVINCVAPQTLDDRVLAKIQKKAAGSRKILA